MAYEQQQQAPEVRSSPYQSPMYNYGSAIVHLTNPEEEIGKLELAYRNQVLDKDGNPLKAGTPLMNDEGISSVTGQVRAIVNRITIFSALNPNNEIKALLGYLADNLALDLMIHHKRYALDRTNRSKVYFAAITTAYICMKRASSDAGDLSDKKFWRGSVQEVNTKVDTGQQSSGILSKLTGWKKGN